ncbi:MAG: hypothetical protein AB7S92_22600, partial [Parvibaculaceae bacterium]
MESSKARFGHTPSLASDYLGCNFAIGRQVGMLANYGNHPLRTAGDDVLRMRPEIGSGGAVYTREAPIPRQELCEISD